MAIPCIGDKMVAEQRSWFRKRTPDEGWGIRPNSQAGWIATALFVVVDVGGVAVLGQFLRRPPYVWILLAWAFGWLVALVTLAIAKTSPSD